MLIIKKIQTQNDFELVEKQFPNAASRIYLLTTEGGKSSFFPMTPMDKSDTKCFFGLLPRLNATIWEGGYYVGDCNFDLKFDGAFANTAAPRRLLAAITVRISGIDTEKDVSAVTGLIRNGELHEEDLQRALNSAKDEFFNTLARSLYEEETPGDAIFELALESLSRFFPCLKAQVLFARIDEELTPAEKAYKESMEKLNDARRKMDLEVKERQSKSDMNISIMEIEENEDAARNAVTLRRQERELSEKNNELQLRLLNETANDKVELEKAKIRKEKELILLELEKVKNEFATAETLRHHAEIEKRLLEKREAEEGIEAQRKAELYELDRKIREAKLEKLRLEAEEIKKRVEAVKTASDAAYAVPAAETPVVITNDAIEKQQTRVKMLHEDMLNAVSGIKDEELLNMLQEKSGCGKGVELTKALTPVKITPRGLALEIEFDDNAVKIGDRMEISFTSPVEGYLTLLCFSTSGAVTLLSPNIIDGKLRLEAGVTYTMPGPGLLRNSFIRQQGPCGRERIAAIVAPESLAPAIPAGIKGFVDLDASELSSIIARLEKFAPECWAAGYLGYSVVQG
ncbi:MAG: DUF4384 domain-containing protein [Lentisphaeria bacterium]|nr:DUF4384 domain-containing protein [Lentisphaeria bacterium]